MELMTEGKKGFKRTDVGLIPEDWEVKQLKDCISEPLQYGIGAAAVDFNLNLPRYLRITDISDEGYLIEENKASVKVKEYSNYLLENDDIVLARTGASVGKSYHLNRDNFSGELVFAGFLIKVRSDTKKLNPIYLKYFFKCDPYWHWVKVNSMRSGQPGINSQEYSSLKIPIPPTLEEQQAIATALSDTDELIRSLDGLIAKKEAIKKGTMQQLLTGKKRLPGFDGEWEVKKLGEVGNTFNGLSGKRKDDFGDGNHPYITFLNVMNNTVIDTSIFDSVKVKRGESQSEVKKGDLLFNTSSETPEEVGMCSVLLENVENLHLNSFCFGYRIHEPVEVLPLFLAYYFRSEFGREHMKALAQGSTRYNLSKSKFVKIEVELPGFEEQKAIAGILSDMDEELSALRRKREKMQRVKEGMMQQLLTGRIRIYGMEG